MPKTDFLPQRDGFAFRNYWALDQAESDEVISLLNASVDDALSVLNPLFPPPLIMLRLGRKLVTWAETAVPQTYGLCGGTAFAALDYYNAKIPIPLGTEPPTRANTAGTTLRDYLQHRQLDSLKDNLPTILAWMAVLNLIPSWRPFKGGAAWLLDQSKAQWNTLTTKIDANQPVPLAIIGTTMNPMQNHQVLAVGYDDPHDGTGTIFVYDMNCPGAEQSIQLDFRGLLLFAVETCPNNRRGALRGFICVEYTPAKPPIVTDWMSPAPTPS